MRLIVPLLALAFALAGCASLPFTGIGGGDQVVMPDVPRETTVSGSQAISMINDHRRRNGRPPLQHDPRLSAIAKDTAQELARRGQIKTRMHTAAGLQKRLDAADYPAIAAAENLAGGHPTLVMAVDGWKSSRGHNKNLLNENVSHAGIGLVVTDSAYKSYWVLIFAAPGDAV